MIKNLTKNILLSLALSILVINTNTFAAQNNDSLHPYKTSEAQGNLIIDKNNINSKKHKISSTIFNTTDKRQFLRFNINEINKPVILKQNISNNIKLKNISRGGIAIQHNKNVQNGEIIPVEIIYDRFSLSVNARIISSSDTFARAQFIDLDTEKTNKLLYLSIRLEEDNNMLATRLR